MDEKLDKKQDTELDTELTDFEDIDDEKEDIDTEKMVK